MTGDEALTGHGGYPWHVLADGHVILTDTGSFLSEGRISCMDLLTHEVWQSRDSEP
ncbi:hypothetical protein [Mitsuokella multacida]|uniref:hypothetical protein n=1 Tax=Mitsuokella multacida TaxID=52226 RepID=UPI0026DCC3AD|nr:hypothetical protein [Mitsuokella multacida]